MPSSSDPPPFWIAEQKLKIYDARIVIALASGDYAAAARAALSACSLLNKYNLISRAVRYSDIAVEALGMLPTARALSFRPLAVSALQKSGINHLLLGHMHTAADRLHSGQRLVDDSVPPRQIANLHWDSAVYYHWSHAPLPGLAHALRAWEYYSTSGPAIERSRLRLQIAQLAMDLAIASRSLGAFTSSYEYLRLAEEHVFDAQPRSQSLFAPAVDLTFLLAYARLSRMTNRDEGRLSLLESAEQRASNMNSVLAQGQALTALGDELAALGYAEAARARRRLAIDVLSSSPSPGMVLLPQRALLLAQEFGDE